MRPLWPSLVLLAVASAMPTAASAQTQDPLWVRSLEELMEIEVITASKREQRVGDISAAVFVVTREDIRRSGLDTLPDVLRLVPGVHVGQVDGSKWAVSVRGFNSRWANKLLVLLDGRTIYSDVFSGVYWDAIDVPVELIERIEVVRGPGGSVWGANAVNGVLNIITKTPRNSGTEITSSIGNIGRRSVTARHAGALGDRVRYQVYGSGSDQGTSFADTNDAWQSLRAGASVAATLSPRDELQVQATALSSDTGSLIDNIVTLEPLQVNRSHLALESAGQHASARWTRALSGEGQLEIGGAWSNFRRDEQVWEFDSEATELSLQHTVRPLGRHLLTWGAGYRRSTYDMTGSDTFAITPADDVQTQAGLFVQDDLSLVRERLTLTLGSKIERFTHTGWHWQPTVRTHWHPTARSTMWMAASRAVRTPSLSERGMSMFMYEESGDLPARVYLSGNPDLQAEHLRALEAGYRWGAAAISIDVAAYFNRYTNLANIEVGEPSLRLAPALHIHVPLPFDNKLNADTVGGEADLTVVVTPRWRLQGSYSLFTVSSHFDADTTLTDVEPFDADAPRHQGMVRSLVTLPRGLEFDAAMFRVSGLSTTAVPATTRFDVRVGWHAFNRLDVSLAARNALDSRHAEFTSFSNLVVFAPVRRQVALRAAWSF